LQGVGETMIAIKKDGICTIFKVTEEVTANEILIQLTQYMGGEPTDNAIWDFSDAAKIKISTLEMKGIADSLKKLSSDDRPRRVALVGSKTINIGLGKLFAAFAQMAGLPNTYKVFRDIDNAEQWLRCCSDNK
jgi:hypothetical protein